MLKETKIYGSIEQIPVLNTQGKDYFDDDYTLISPKNASGKLLFEGKFNLRQVIRNREYRFYKIFSLKLSETSFPSYHHFEKGDETFIVTLEIPQDLVTEGIRIFTREHIKGLPFIAKREKKVLYQEKEQDFYVTAIVDPPPKGIKIPQNIPWEKFIVTEDGLDLLCGNYYSRELYAKRAEERRKKREAEGKQIKTASNPLIKN